MFYYSFRFVSGVLKYQAQSPDESALVSAARNFGVVFKERTPNSVTVDVMGETRVHELLCILDFNNTRRRMSAVFRENGKIRLYCKGADSVLFDRLEPGDEEYKATTLQHLNVSIREPPGNGGIRAARVLIGFETDDISFRAVRNDARVKNNLFPVS